MLSHRNSPKKSDSELKALREATHDGKPPGCGVKGGEEVQAGLFKAAPVIFRLAWGKRSRLGDVTRLTTLRELKLKERRKEKLATKAETTCKQGLGRLCI